VRIAHVTCRIAHVTYLIAHVTRRIAHVTCLTAHVTCLIAHVTCRIAHVTTVKPDINLNNIITYNNSVSTSQRTHLFSSTKAEGTLILGQ